MSKRSPISSAKKRKVTQRANHRCEYCKCLKKYSPGPFDIEHIIPISKGGTSDLDNLAYSCSGCNGAKYNKIKAIDIVTNQLQALYNPRKESWSDHFNWSNDGLMIIGITPIGRVTVDALSLNREELLNIRGLLQLIGEHPPKD